jgi:hypothetical protein
MEKNVRKIGPRLGDFSPVGRFLCTLGVVLKISEVAHAFGATRFHGKSKFLTKTPKFLGYILGDLFTNASGHPVIPLRFACYERL